jgi:putative aminopeptidase FrvX
VSNAPGPSGLEEPVRAIMVERMTPLADQLSYDGLGSLIATQGRHDPRALPHSFGGGFGGTDVHVRQVV